MPRTEAVIVGPRMEVSPPISPPKRPASSGLATPPRDQSLAERIRTDTCFKCQKQGHWAKDCPSKTPIKPNNDTNLPVILCPLGHGSCSVQTSSSEKNPNRKYYECPRKRTGGCDFFKWYDEMILPGFIPVCGCGAGRCCVDRVKIGPHAGRWFFTCRVQKGHGACKFFQWEDAQTTGPIILDNAHHASRLSEAVICPQLLSGNVSVAEDALIGGTQLTAVNHKESSREEHVVKSLKNIIPSLLEFKSSQDRVSLERSVNPMLDVLGEFIRSASSLAQLEQAIGGKPTLQDFLDRYNHEKDRVDDISRKHSEALDALNASDEKARRLKDELIQIESKLACCETETLKLKTCMDEISKEKIECERSLQTAEEFLRVAQKKEEELVAAKESFEKAKKQLQQQ